MSAGGVISRPNEVMGPSTCVSCVCSKGQSLKKTLSRLEFGEFLRDHIGNVGEAEVTSKSRGGGFEPCLHHKKAPVWRHRAGVGRSRALQNPDMVSSCQKYYNGQGHRFSV